MLRAGENPILRPAFWVPLHRQPLMDALPLTARPARPVALPCCLAFNRRCFLCPHSAVPSPVIFHWLPSLLPPPYPLGSFKLQLHPLELLPQANSETLLELCSWMECVLMHAGCWHSPWREQKAGGGEEDPESWEGRTGCRVVWSPNVTASRSAVAAFFLLEEKIPKVQREHCLASDVR